MEEQDHCLALGGDWHEPTTAECLNEQIAREIDGAAELATRALALRTRLEQLEQFCSWLMGESGPFSAIAHNYNQQYWRHEVWRRMAMHMDAATLRCYDPVLHEQPPAAPLERAADAAERRH